MPTGLKGTYIAMCVSSPLRSHKSPSGYYYIKPGYVPDNILNQNNWS